MKSKNDKLSLAARASVHCAEWQNAALLSDLGGHQKSGSGKEIESCRFFQLAILGQARYSYYSVNRIMGEVMQIRSALYIFMNKLLNTLDIDPMCL